MTKLCEGRTAIVTGAGSGRFSGEETSCVWPRNGSNTAAPVNTIARTSISVVRSIGSELRGIAAAARPFLYAHHGFVGTPSHGFGIEGSLSLVGSGARSTPVVRG